MLALAVVALLAGQMEHTSMRDDASMLTRAPRSRGWYVDSVNGDDTNTGTGPSAPLRTIAAVMTKNAANPREIRLARGSYWREQLTTSGVVQAYGTGPRPILDASDPASNASFVKTAGRTNVYQIAWSHQLYEAGKIKHSVWEDGVRLTRAASLDACDTTPGSFYAASPTDNGTDTIYVHATGSEDVSANARLYELARRRHGLTWPARAVSIHTRRNGHNNGSLLANVAKDCLAEDGTVHNMWVGSTCEDSVAWKNEWYSSAGASTLFITFTGGSSAGATYRRCHAIGSNQSGAVGFYFHTNGGAANISDMVFEDCTAINVNEGFGGANALRAVYRNSATWGVARGITANPSESLTVEGHLFNGYGHTGLQKLVRAVNPGSAGSNYIRNTRLIARVSSGAFIWFSGYPLVVENSTIAIVADSFPQQAFDNIGAMAMHNTILSGSSSPHVKATSIVSDYNVVTSTANDWIIGGVTYTDFASYRAATGQDANSIGGAPGFIGDLSTGWDTRVGAGSNAALVGAGATVPATNPDYGLAALWAKYGPGGTGPD